MSEHRFTAPDPAGAAAACAQHVVRVLQEALSGQEVATLAISGGASPRLLFDQLVAAPIPWERVHLFWVDERMVPPTDPASNYKLADDHLIRPAKILPNNVHRIFGEMTPSDAAAQYVADIREFFGLKEGDFPRFDLLHRGIGPDGHTASLFPNDPLLDDRQNIAAPVYSTLFQQWRVTLLPGTLQAAKQTVLLATGADKEKAVHAVFHEPYNPKKYPSQLATRDGREAAWFLDEPAARLID